MSFSGQSRRGSSSSGQAHQLGEQIRSALVNLDAHGIGFQTQCDVPRRAALVVLEIQLGAMIGQELDNVIGSLAGRGVQRGVKGFVP